MTLLERLRECVEDDREIEPILSLAVGASAQILSASMVEYRTSSANAELFARIRFKSGRISSIEPGPALQSVKAQEALLERARTEAAHTHGTLVASRVLFSERPLAGTYMWNDSVRIGPCPDTTVIGKGLDWFDHGLPNQFMGGHLGPPFPFLLEVRVPRSPNPFLESNRTLRALDRYQYLFTLLLAGHIRFVHWPSGRVWALLKPSGVPQNHLVHPSFSTTEGGQQDDFPIREFEPAPILKGDDYYERLWPKDSELLIPSSLADDLELIQSLNREKMDSFVRASYWYAIGIQFHSEPSIAGVAFSTAIECLLPQTKTAICKACGKPTGTGPTQLFKRHVKRFGTVIPALESRRQTLYDVRSALVHGSHASRVDIDFLSAQRHAEDHLLLLQIVSQRSLVNWLRDPRRDVWHIGEDYSHQCAA
ncbi:MAG: hypothetical protein HYZ49_02725 [Chloroflexi bacterium]|nr:hypothetical protein [Chloroflexota bacterium]